MSTKTIAPRGFVNLISAEEGPERNVRVVSFLGRGDSGFIPAHFNAGEPPVAIINVGTGLLEAAGHFIAPVTGGISQDTGAGNVAGQTFFAIVTDTGTAGV
jgi:hypothetical protein